MDINSFMGGELIIALQAMDDVMRQNLYQDFPQTDNIDLHLPESVGLIFQNFIVLISMIDSEL